MGTQNWHNVPFLKSFYCLSFPYEKEKKGNKKTKKKLIYKISKKGNKKKSCHLVPKVVIDLSYEGGKVEGSRKYRRRESVPKVGSKS